MFYQTYPRSFQVTSGNGIGDIPGIINHLDELKYSGIGAIWLSPVYPSPNSDFGYEVSQRLPPGKEASFSLKNRWKIIKKTASSARTPMQWSDEPNSGFTTGTTWLIVNPNYTLINLKPQFKSPNQIRNFYKKMIAIGSQSEILKLGSYKPIETKKYLFVYKRTYKTQSLITVLDFSQFQKKFNFTAKVLLSNYKAEFFYGALNLMRQLSLRYDCAY